MSEFGTSGPLNYRDRPRILLLAVADFEADSFNWVEERAGTFRRVRRLEDVDLTEWDVIVTREPYVELDRNQAGPIVSRWGRLPDHLFIFRVFREVQNPARSYFESNLDEDGDADLARALSLANNVAGHNMLGVAGLPEPIQDLIKSDLLPSLERRKKQFGIVVGTGAMAPAVLKWRPFVLGPSGLAMAGSYERVGGKHVWLLPEDTTNLPGWFDAALVEWHIADPRTFPSLATWQTDAKWDTAKEVSARKALQELDTTFATVETTFRANRATAEAALEEAAKKAKSGPKSLLNGQDDPLQQAALQALRDLGFQVEDMDLIWGERERREDFRIRDGDQPDWLVLADATGVTKGAPGSKITTVVGYVTKYILEGRAAQAPGVWIIVNRLFHRDPLVRGEIYRSDEVTVLKSHDGLALDSAALYLLSQTIQPGSERAGKCRAWLRARKGQVMVEDAIEWLATNQ